jgi:hypothetical protein
MSSKKGLCKALGTNVFDCGQKAAADQMQTSWEKITKYVGTTYRQDISNELQNKTTVVITELVHAPAVLLRNQTREVAIRVGQDNLQAARRASLVILIAQVDARVIAGAPIELANLQNEIAHGDLERVEPIEIQLTDFEKSQHSNEWRTYRERNASLVKCRGQTCSLILGQCSQLLKDKMKQDVDWTTVSISYDPLTLCRLIEKTELAQTEDQHPFATVYDQEMSFYSFCQSDAMSNPQWCKRFNTKVDVGVAIGVTCQHKSLLEHVAQEQNATGTVDVVTFDSLSTTDQDLVRKDAEERHISHTFLRQSGPQHGKLKVDLQNDFTAGNNYYPKTRQQTLHLLDKHSKTAVTKPTPSEGASFAQGGGDGNGKAGKKKEAYDKACWKGKTCYKCNGKDHPANHCPKSSKTEKSDDDDASAASTAESVNKLKKDFKKMSKAFATVNAKLDSLKESKSDLSDEEEASHFQHEEEAFQFAQLDADFEPRISSLFKQIHGDNIALDLKEIMLLDSQSTMDLFCNPKLVEKICESTNDMRLKSNGGSMMVSYKAKHPGCFKKAWFDAVALANIMALGNVIQLHQVTYDSNKMMFVVHREPQKPNMEFRMHASGLHCYDPRTEKSKQMVFVNTVSKNMSHFTKQEIKGAELARSLYRTLDSPSMKDYKWIIQSHQIKDSSVTVKDVDVAASIWGKNVSKLKGTTTRNKSVPVTRDCIKVPKELLKLHQNVFLTADMFFCEQNSIFSVT